MSNPIHNRSEIHQNWNYELLCWYSFFQPGCCVIFSIQSCRYVKYLLHLLMNLFLWVYKSKNAVSYHIYSLISSYLGSYYFYYIIKSYNQHETRILYHYYHFLRFLRIIFLYYSNNKTYSLIVLQIIILIYKIKMVLLYIKF